MATSTLGSGTLVLAGTTSGTTTVTATAVAGTTTLTLPAATDTLVGKATTDTLTNKTLTGAAMNGTLGATTPSTVAATTISASSTATFAAGAAGTPSITTSGDTNTGIFFPAADTIAFAEGGVEAARFDSSGNFGLGVTPSSFFNTWKVFQLGYSASLSSQTATNIVSLDSNRYQNGSNNPIYIQNGYASSYYQYNGQHVWQTAASGTAGNAITFTQAMTLDASGNLGVAGQTAPSTPLTTGTWGNGLAVGTTTGTNGIVVVSSASSSLSGLRFGDGGTGSQFDQGFVVYDHSADSLILGTSRTERARIDSSGNLLVGKTSSNNGTNGAQLSPTTQFFTNTNDYIALFNRKGTDGVSIYFQKDETNVGNISVTTSATAYNTSSDYRLKNTIAPMTGALAKVALLKPCTYKWNADGSDGQGFIAHELAEVVPQCVTGEKDAVDADGKPQYQGIDTSFLVATLTAAIKEQQAIIQSLTARITALESA